MKRILPWIAGIGVVGLIAVILNPKLLMIPLVATGLYTGLRSDAPFVQAHKRAVKSFVESEGFGISRLRRKNLWNERTVLFEGTSCEPRAINLIGLTEENGKRYFEDARPPKKKGIPSAASRELNAAELATIEAFQLKDTPYVKLAPLKDYEKFDMIRVIAPIRAEKSCLECHAGKVGDVLGAFDYHLLPIARSDR